MKQRILAPAAIFFLFFSNTYGQTLQFPENESIIHGYNQYFKWDSKDIFAETKVFQLIIKEVNIDQHPISAMDENSKIYEAEVINNEVINVNFQSFSTKNNQRYVWQVITYTISTQNAKEEISKSTLRTFLVDNNSKLEGWLQVDSSELGNVNETTRAPVTGCENANIEYGNFLGWDGYYGSRLNSGTVYLGSLANGLVNGRHTIRQVSDGFVLQVGGGTVLPQVSEGNYSIRLGNQLGGGEVDLIKYTFTVNPTNSNFSFKYALVLQDPGHKPDQQPFFAYYIKRGSSINFSGGNPSNPLNNNALITFNKVVADANNPFFKPGGNIVLYRDWTPTCIDLSLYMGKTVTIVFLVTDCSLGGHSGYAYIDALCENNDAIASFTMPNEICAHQDLIIDGTASVNETSYFWSIEESDASGGRPNPSSEVSDWVIAQHAGTINYSSLYSSKGKKFKCNTYYRIKLAVNNNCSAWNEMVKLLYVRCPNVSAGPDQCVSCTLNNNSVQLGIGNSTHPKLSYSWSPSTGLNNANSASPFHQEGSTAYPITYTVVVTDNLGCTNSDQVTLYCEKPTLTLESVRHCCGYSLIANAQNYDEITWSTGQSGVTSIDVSAGGTYTVVLSNVCGQVSQSITIPGANILTGPFHPIAYNSKFHPPAGGGGLPDKFYIKDVINGNGAANVPNSYNATEYELRIYNRWGGQFKTIKGFSCTGFSNWAINWDGTDANGALVPQGVYVWQLRFKNCTYTCLECQCPIERKFVDLTCVDCAFWPGPGCKWYNHCKKWNVPPGTTIDVPICEGSVTVVR